MAFGSARQNNEERLIRIFHSNSGAISTISRYGESTLPISTSSNSASAGIKCASNASFVVTAGTTTGVGIYNFPAKNATSLGTAIRTFSTTSSAAKAIAISPDLLKIAVGGGNTVITIISRTSTSQSWAAATTATITAGGQVYSLDFGIGSDYPLAVGIGTTPYIEAWYFNGTTWTKTTAFAALGGLGGGTSNHSVQTVAFNSTGTLLAVATSTAPYVKTYSKSGNTYTSQNTTSIGAVRIDSLLWLDTNILIACNTSSTAYLINQPSTGNATILSNISSSGTLRGLYMDPVTKNIFGATNGGTLYRSKLNPSYQNFATSWVSITGTTSISSISGYSEEQL